MERESLISPAGCGGLLCTLHPAHSTLTPKPYTLHRKPQTLRRKPLTRDPASMQGAGGRRTPRRQRARRRTREGTRSRSNQVGHERKPEKHNLFERAREDSHQTVTSKVCTGASNSLYQDVRQSLRFSKRARSMKLRARRRTREGTRSFLTLIRPLTSLCNRKKKSLYSPVWHVSLPRGGIGVSSPSPAALSHRNVSF